MAGGGRDGAVYDYDYVRELRRGSRGHAERADHEIDFPKGFIPFSKTVFGNLPLPHNVNELKSLCQSPSGAIGSVLAQVWSDRKSASVIFRSSTLCRR